MNSAISTHPVLLDRWQRFSAAAVRGFHAYAIWLVSISWKRFFLLAVAFLIGMAILKELPPFTWRTTQQVEIDAEHPSPAPATRPVPKPPVTADRRLHYEIKIDDHGVRIFPSPAASAASGPVSGLPSIAIDLPSGVNSGEVKQAVEEARQAIEGAIKEAAEAAAETEAEAARAAAQAAEPRSKKRYSTTVTSLGDFLPNLAMLLILSSIVIKVTYKGRIQAEVKAAQATETAEAESLKRQVIEARMAAMQAQVEPHFLFNTLASIDHLIETDPPRASLMQKNLIALLRASMPTMREANAGGARDLGRELAVIKPYLDILKVRMEERLQTVIDVPDGLLSAEFPPMMIQSLVENAIKHGLEPKAEGGSLGIKAEILHGKLALTVTDTGLGFGRADTAGTGVGLANIRERLNLLYGTKGTVTVTESQPSGTRVTITIPYRSCNEEGGLA